MMKDEQTRILLKKKLRNKITGHAISYSWFTKFILVLRKQAFDFNIQISLILFEHVLA